MAQAVAIGEVGLDANELRVALGQLGAEPLVERLDLARGAAQIVGEPRILDRDRRDVGELAEHGRGCVVERAAAQPVIDVDAPGDHAALSQRHREHRAQPQRGDTRRDREPLVDARIDGDHRFAGLRGTLGDRPRDAAISAREIAHREVA